MTLNIEQLRNKFKQATAKAEASSSSSSSSYFPFSALKVGDEVRIRFVDDGEPNDVFWRERRTRAIPFTSVKQANGMVVPTKCWVDVPAFNLKYNEVLLSNLPDNYLYKSDEDVIQNKIKGFWDQGEEGKELYYRYGRKKTYIFQGFVRSEGYEPNKLYRFTVNEELFNLIKSFLSDTEIDANPTDVNNGLDFILRVTPKTANINGRPQEVKDYVTSGWSRKSSPLTDEEKASLEATPAFVLKDYIFAKPTAEQEQTMVEMFEASMSDEPYDVTKWGKIYRPNNIFFDADGNIRDSKNGTPQATEIPSRPSVQSTVSASATESVASTPTTNGFSVEQMQAMLAQMQAQQATQSAPKPTASQLINESTETVVGTNPDDTIANLMSKFGVK